MTEEIKTITKTYNTVGINVTEEGLDIAKEVMSLMFIFMKQQGIDIHFQRRLEVTKEHNVEAQRYIHYLSFRACLLPSDGEVGIEHNHAHPPVIGLTRRESI